LLQRGSDDAADDVGWAARRIGDHDFDRTLRIIGMRRAPANERRNSDPAGKRAYGF